MKSNELLSNPLSRSAWRNWIRVLKLVASCIRARNFKRRRRNIGRVDFGLRKFFRQSQSNAPGSGPDVGNPNRMGPTVLARRSGTRRPALSEFQHCLYQVLRLRPRNQNRRSDDKIHPPEFLMSRDVLRRHAACSLRQHRLVAGLFLRSQLALRMRKKVGPVAVQREHQQQFSIQPRGRYVLRRESRNGRGERFFQLHSLFHATG